MNDLTLPKNADETLNAIKALTGLPISKNAASELEVLINDGLSPDFIEEANISNLADHLLDLRERCETLLDASSDCNRYESAEDARKIKKTARECFNLVRQAVASL
jgi:hypothetical protein